VANKVLGQLNPLAVTLTALYTVPASKEVVTSSIVVTNRSAVATSFRISVAVAGAVDDNKQYLYYDISIPGNDTFIATIGITLAATDVVRVYATLATLSFNLFGTEN
jgi:ribosomal protein S2